MSILLLLFMPISSMQKDWETEQVNYTHIASTIGQIESAIGYVGFIHHFKNYVLRRETNALEQSLAEMAQVKKLLADLNTNMQSKEQLTAIGNIAGVLAEYKKGANVL